MKSGRMQIVFGSTVFDLLDGNPSEAYQEAVSIRIKEKEADVAVLGKIEKKLVLSPVLEDLLPDNS